jgi:geranylgeranyl pyrophosphate synthase
MSGLPRTLERLLGRAAGELRELVGDELAGEDALRLLIGRGHAEDLRELFEGERLRIRPLLVTLSARAAGAASVGPELQHAAEVLHLALTLHDVTLGQPGGRRRRVARRVLKRVGRSHLTVRALELARHASAPDALGEVVDTLRSFSDGEALAAGIRDSGLVPGTREVEEHADTYHGALLAFCCRVGGHAAGADPVVVGTLGRYGRHVGRLWTHADDLVHLGSDDAAEHLAERAAAGRPVHAVAHAATVDPRVAAAWMRLVREGQGADELVQRVRAAGGGSATREVMARASWTARQALRSMPESPYREGLDVLAAGLARAS